MSVTSDIDDHASARFSLFNAADNSTIVDEDRVKEFFEAPRDSCEDIAPELKRLQLEEDYYDQQHQLGVYKNIMERARVRNIDKHLQRIVDLDRSNKIQMSGRYSSCIYFM